MGMRCMSCAEYISLPANLLAPMPHNLDFDHAAALAHGARTAKTGLFELGDLQAGQRVLIHGGGTNSLLNLQTMMRRSTAGTNSRQFQSS